MKKDDPKIKEAPNKSKPNNSTNTLKSYLPKDVLEEIDINDSSKTHSLSKNSSSDKSMDKTTKSQTNHNNNNGNSDSNGNSNNSNDNGKNGMTSDEKDHGTHVAGIMAAKTGDSTGICGVYPYGDGNLYGVSYGNGISESNQNSALISEFAKLG